MTLKQKRIAAVVGIVVVVGVIAFSLGRRGRSPAGNPMMEANIQALAGEVIQLRSQVAAVSSQRPAAAPQVDLTPIRNELAALRQEQQALKKQMSALEQRLPKNPIDVPAGPAPSFAGQPDDRVTAQAGNGLRVDFLEARYLGSQLEVDFQVTNTLRDDFRITIEEETVARDANGAARATSQILFAGELVRVYRGNIAAGLPTKGTAYFKGSMDLTDTLPHFAVFIRTPQGDSWYTMRNLPLKQVR